MLPYSRFNWCNVLWNSGLRIFGLTNDRARLNERKGTLDLKST